MPSPLPHSASPLKRAGLVAGAAGVATLGLAHAASADIVYTDPADLTITATGSNVSIFFDLATGYSGYANSTTTSAFQLGYGFTANGMTPVGDPNQPKLIPSSTTTSGVLTTPIAGGTTAAARLSLNDPVAGTFATGTQFLHGTTAGTAYPWNAGDRGYLGLQFTPTGATAPDFGWANVSYNADQSVTLYNFAYENSGGAIAAGAVPEPSTLAEAAVLGAAGLLAWRRRREQRPLTTPAAIA